MPLNPFAIVGMWLRGLLSLAVVGLAVFSLVYWYNDLPAQETVPVQRGEEVVYESRPLGPGERIAAWRPGLDLPTALLAGGLLLTLFTFAGRFFSPLLFRPRGKDEPHALRSDEVRRLKRPDGSELQVEFFGPADGPPVILTHGWGTDSTEWYYLKKAWAERYRVIVWDLPGLGRSTRPADNDYSLEKMARDLHVVLGVAAGRPATLVGHSIGGMIIQTFCRLFPEELGSRVDRIVLAHTTYTSPLRTMKNAGLYTALQKPVLEPLLHLTIWLSPLVWLMNCLSYLNGTAHWSNHRQSFAGTETWGQLDFSARYYLKQSPAVVARGIFGMLRFDATDVLGRITPPVLVLVGDQDTTTCPEAGEFIRARVPAGQLVTLAPASHLSPLERHDEFAQAAESFLAGGATARSKRQARTV